MTHTFYLKTPNSESESLILFSCYFKNEKKKFVYSTGETILPKHWNKESKGPKARAKFAGVNSLRMQLNRYSEAFMKAEERHKLIKEDFTSNSLKSFFQMEFKKVESGSKDFFGIYDEFTTEKKMNQDWSAATIKRYKNIKTILQNFEKEKSYKLSFTSINSKFHSKFTDYCMGDLKHINNTYARNLGLVKTFLFWALDKKYTYNDEFKKFKKKERVITNQVVLDKEELEKLMNHKFELKSLERTRDIFVFAAVTGMRYGELKFISKRNVVGTTFHLKEEKGSEKEIRTIPLSKVAIHILEKYDYNLPVTANQKHNEYIKIVFEKAGFTHMVQKVTTRGKEVIRKDMLFHKRVSSHTARRTFITMMKRDGKSDKLISKITGHRDMKTLNSYYQVDSDEKKEAVDAVFDISF
ncbi:tyrosine-type recombinase/integrase [Nonlabens mediterrranea]|uniref:Tyrosine-type recombinase/integrase n=1 Tax=Nonlabens mediterrranea TaxID=1419947 RepID=A0ABS0A5V3_9FLAO|nr:tyrosine-type recombinase/integrase [Nonlabens mediterrranea]